MERTSKQIHDTVEMACQILSKTNDGNDLDPNHLKLVEMAVNGILNDKGKELFTELHKQVTVTGYTKPWFKGVEHVTVDHEWYVYWKGVHVEHFTLSITDNDWKKDTEELAATCREMEKKGLKVNASSYLGYVLNDKEK